MCSGKGKEKVMESETEDKDDAMKDKYAQDFEYKDGHNNEPSPLT